MALISTLKMLVERYNHYSGQRSYSPSQDRQYGLVCQLSHWLTARLMDLLRVVDQALHESEPGQVTLLKPTMQCKNADHSNAMLSILQSMLTCTAMQGVGQLPACKKSLLVLVTCPCSVGLHAASS